jgi:hypothetical protein
VAAEDIGRVCTEMLAFAVAKDLQHSTERRVAIVHEVDAFIWA